VYAADGSVDEARLRPLVERRVHREPLAYVLGEWGFRRLVLRIDRRALVPRPETEIVVERCLALLEPLSAPRVLDVGVGSGAIALAIADEAPHAQVTGVDTSPEALALARENAERLGLAVELREGGFEAAAEGWDLVVANPPYVGPDEIAQLEPEVRDWEPRGALVGEGLHEQLARTARTAWLVLEVAPAQARTVAAELERLGYTDVRVTRDLAARERVVEARWQATARIAQAEVRRRIALEFEGRELAAIREDFDRDWQRLRVIEVGEHACERAAVIADVPFLTYGRRQADAARELGWTVLGA
jgi:release factor glutamine methyltransferase